MERVNYITPEGYAKLESELNQLWSVERPEVVRVVTWAAGNGDRSENADYQYGKKRLREIDKRVRFLRKRIEAAKVVDPAEQKDLDQVFFGAEVDYENSREQIVKVRIVGEDEVDSQKGKISWVSPVARAMMKARVGDVVTFKTPRGDEEIEILAIRY